MCTCLIFPTPALKESRSELRTRSAGNQFQRTTVKGKKEFGITYTNMNLILHIVGKLRLLYNLWLRFYQDSRVGYDLTKNCGYELILLITNLLPGLQSWVRLDQKLWVRIDRLDYELISTGYELT